MTSTGPHVVAVGAAVVVVMALPSFLWAHSYAALAWGWLPVLGCVLFLAWRRELASVVPLVALGAATSEFLEASPWPVPAVQLPDARPACVALHLALVGWVLWRVISGRGYAMTAAGVLIALMSFHETFTEGTAPRQILTALRHALAVWSLVWLMARERPNVRGVLRAASLIVLLIAALAPWAMNLGSSISQLLLMLDAVVLFLLLTRGGQTEGWRCLVRIGVALGVGVTLLGMARVLTWWSSIGAWAAFDYRLKVAGLHENLVAAILAAAAPLIMTQMVQLRRCGRVLLALILPLWTLALVLTYSRGGWAGASAGLLVLFYLTRRRSRWLLPVAVCVALAALTLVSPVGRTVARRLHDPAEGLQGRKEAWLATGRMVLERPLRGHGWDAGYARARYATSLASSKYLLSHAHNLPLEIAYSYGLVGLALAGWLWVAAVRGVRVRGPWAIAGAATTTAVVVHGFVAQPLVCPAVAALFLIGLSLASGDTLTWGRSRLRTTLFPAWIVLLWAGSAAPVLVAPPGTTAAARRFLTPLETEPWQQEATGLRAAGRPGEAVVRLEQALRQKKEFPPLLTDLGWTLWEAGRPAEAAQAMRAAYRLDPQGIHGGEHLTELGYMVLQQGREAEARSVLEAAARREPYGFRKHPWVIRKMEGGAMEACLPGPGADRDTLKNWLRGDRACRGLSARELMTGSQPVERDDYLWLGSALHCLRCLEDAASVLEHGLEAWPADGALSFRLAEVYRDAKRWGDEAELCHRNGLAYREAEARLALGHWEEALEAVARDVARREYRLANDFWIRAQALWRLGRHDEAVSWGRTSLFCLFRPERAVQLADWLAMDSRSREACEAYRTVLRHLARERNRRWGGWDWRYVDHVTRLATALSGASVRETCPVTGSSLIELVARSRAAGGEEAVRLATLAARKAPEEPWLWLNQADVQAGASDIQGALQSLGLAVFVGADPARLLEREGHLLAVEGRDADALSAFSQGAALEGQNGRWLVKIGEALSRRGYENGAAAALSGAGRREKDWADPHILLAEWWAEREREEESEAEHLRAIRADPYSSWARDSYGRRLLIWSRPRDALAQLQSAAALEPLAPKPPYRMAQAHLALGDTAAALDQLERAVSLDPSFAPAARLLQEVQGG